jgi:hypothetical protein
MSETIARSTALSVDFVSWRGLRGRPGFQKRPSPLTVWLPTPQIPFARRNEERRARLFLPLLG